MARIKHPGEAVVALRQQQLRLDAPAQADGVDTRPTWVAWPIRDPLYRVAGVVTARCLRAGTVNLRAVISEVRPEILRHVRAGAERLSWSIEVYDAAGRRIGDGHLRVLSDLKGRLRAV
jgi:hypothetical protein